MLESLMIEKLKNIFHVGLFVDGIALISVYDVMFMS